MPVATVSLDTVHRKLTKLNGGFVELRRFTYGEKLHFDALVQLSIPRIAEGEGERLDLSPDTARQTAYAFTHCIISHNLERLTDPKDPNSPVVPLNFRNQAEIDMLDPAVGDEIINCINELNAGEDLSGGDDPSQSFLTASVESTDGQGVPA